MLAHSRMWLKALLVAAAIAALAGCSSKSEKMDVPEGLKLAVAGFTNPQNTSELLAGCLPEICVLVSPEALANLDTLLSRELNKGDRQVAVQPMMVSRCQQLVQTQQGATKRIAALKYWVEVGKCAGADALLVPQVMAMRQKDIAAEEPASVTMDLFLIGVEQETILKRAHFEETQQSLLENLFKVGKFVKRGGKWVTAEELAAEGMKEMVEELGL